MSLLLNHYYYYHFHYYHYHYCYYYYYYYLLIILLLWERLKFLIFGLFYFFFFFTVCNLSNEILAFLYLNFAMYLMKIVLLNYYHYYYYYYCYCAYNLFYVITPCRGCSDGGRKCAAKGTGRQDTASSGTTGVDGEDKQSAARSTTGNSAMWKWSWKGIPGKFRKLWFCIVSIIFLSKNRYNWNVVCNTVRNHKTGLLSAL